MSKVNSIVTLLLVAAVLVVSLIFAHGLIRDQEAKQDTPTYTIELSP